MAERAKTTRLKVAEAVQDDVNRGIARVDSGYMREIDVRPGDIIEITGNRMTAAIVDRAYPGDIGANIIRMDGMMRRNAGTSIGEEITIIKADVKPAKRVVIAPARSGIVVKASPHIFKNTLIGRALVKGDIIALGGPRKRRAVQTGDTLLDTAYSMMLNDEAIMPFGFGDLKFVVAETNPKGTALITSDTDVVLNPEAVEVKEERLEVSYEDIGGLHEEISKIREMVELPLKHPEIFERLGIEPPKGVLLHGPPGTGKTLLAKAVAAETNSHFLVINGPEIMCVDGETPILTNPRGTINAKTIFANATGKKIRDDHISITALDNPITTYAFSGNRLRKAHITHVTKLKAPAFKVTLSDGNELTCSTNQPFLTFEEGHYEWKRLEDITPGTLVARANMIALPEKRQTLHLPSLARDAGRCAPRSRNIRRSNWIRLPRHSSPGLLEYLGLIAAEGHIAEDGVTFCNTNPHLRRHYSTLLKDVFDITKSKTYADGRVVVYSKALVAYLAQFGLAPGKKSPTVPTFLHRATKVEVAAFVRGYFEGDGTVTLNGNYPTPKLYSASKRFLHELQGILMLKLGIGSSVNKHPTPKGMMHVLTVRGNAGRVGFAQRIGAITADKRSRLKRIRANDREHENIPTPHLLLQALRTKVPYAAYRNKDWYVYKKGPFTKHALRTLYDIATTHRAVDHAVKSEHRALMRNDIAWEAVTDVKPVGTQDLYDFTVDKDSFIAAPYLLLHNSKFYGESESNLRKKFEEAEKNAPSIIFIDEIDAIATKREDTRGEVERRVVAQLLTLMDGLKGRGKVVVIGATNVPNIIDPALRRPGRFDRELEINAPNKEGRHTILKIHTRNMPLGKDVLLPELAAITHGFVGADLASLAREGAMTALRRVLPTIKYDNEDPLPADILEKIKIMKRDFTEALKVVRPSALREVLVEIPNVKWTDVGGLEDVKQKLKEAVEWPLKHPDAFKRLGTRPPKGILLYGPPGTGKTLLAKAVANESEANFISIKGPELLSKWVGESEKAVREVFKKARQTSPCIIFFDEIDSLVPRRGTATDSGVTERVVNQLLTEIDGIEPTQDIVIIGATNRPDLLDTALLRPGRFDRIILTPAPNTDARLDIFKVHTKGMPLQDVDLDDMARHTENYAGADIESICREAAMIALRDDITAKTITMNHFEAALSVVRPSITKEITAEYEALQEKFTQARAAEMKAEKPVYFG